MLMIREPKGENYHISIIRSSCKSDLHWKDRFHKKPLFFRFYADFEVDNEIEDSKAVCNKTTDIYRQNSIIKYFKIVSETEDVLKSRHYKSPLSNDNVDWFVNETMKLENKGAFSFKLPRKISL